MHCATETQFMRRVNLKLAFISPSLPFHNKNDSMQVIFEYFEYIEIKGCPIKRIQKMRKIVKGVPDPCSYEDIQTRSAGQTVDKRLGKTQVPSISLDSYVILVERRLHKNKGKSFFCSDAAAHFEKPPVLKNTFLQQKPNIWSKL